MGNIQQAFRDITPDGNVWKEDALVMPQHCEVLSKEALLPLPSLFLAPDAGLTSGGSRSSLTRSGSRSSIVSESSRESGIELPDQVVLRTTGLFTRQEEQEASGQRTRRMQWLPMESCKRQRSLLDEVRLRQLRSELPMKCRMASFWRLLYSPEVHGVSIGTFFRQCQAWPSETLLLIEDSNGAVFGGFASHTWQVSKRHFGQADCFVFRFREGDELEVFSSAGHNEYFLHADSSGLKMGGGRHPALWIDENFLKGASGPCPTFGTTSALPGPMESMEFVVTSFECWGFDGSNPLVEDASTPSQRSRAREEACRSLRFVQP